MKIQVTTPLYIHEQGGRAQFEDYLFPDPGNAPADNALFIVTDAGPGNMGRLAAELVAQNFAEYFDILPPAGDVDDAYLEKALRWVEEALSAYIQGNPGSKGMAATIALLHIGPNVASIAWAGDSRVYYYNSKKKELQATEDHSVVNDLIRRGKIQPHEAEGHKDRYRLLRAVQGSENPSQLDTRYLPVKDLNPGDFFLVCSDGMLESISDGDLKTLFENTSDPQQIIDEIRHLSHNNRDNYSCYLVPLTAAGEPVGAPTAHAEVPPQEPLPLAENAAPIVQETKGLLARDYVVYGLIGMMAAALIFLVYWALSRETNPYEPLMTRGNENMKSGNFSQALAQYDSAYHAAEAHTDKERALRLKEKAGRSDAISRIARLDSAGTYPAYMQAIDLATFSIEKYGDEQDTLYKLSKYLGQKMAVIGPQAAFPQLLAEASRLCEAGKNEAAEDYFSAADKFADILKTGQALIDARKACANAYARTETRSAPEVAPAPEIVSRSVAPGPSASGAAETSRSAVPDASPVAERSAGTPSGEVKTAEPRPAGTVGTQEQLRELERGKALYAKAVKSQSSYEFRKAAEYLQNAGAALDGEGYYILARLYQNGMGVRQDLKRSLDNARQSALKGAADGHYLYAHLLLQRLNPGDTLTAKKSLRIAVEKGNKEAELRLRLLAP